MILDLKLKVLKTCNFKNPIKDLGAVVAFWMDDSVKSEIVMNGYLKESGLGKIIFHWN